MHTRRHWLAGCTATALAAVVSKAGAQQAVAEEPQPVIESLRIGESELEVQFAPGFEVDVRQAALAWVQRSAQAVAAYFGRFPVQRAELLLQPVEGTGVRGGVTFGMPSLLIRVRLGRGTTAAQFLDDWVLVHEMVHLAIPRVPRAQSWLQEGIATYVESVARGRARLVPAARVWQSWSEAMPQGQPQAGDAGLDHTPTWGRTYWGGAMFCLLADVELMQRSERRVGLQQALQAVLQAGGSYAVPWTVPRILETADRGTGQTVLVELYERLKDSAQPTDLDRLWRQLGVTRNGLDDSAPWAATRRAILS